MVKEYPSFSIQLYCVIVSWMRAFQKCIWFQNQYTAVEVTGTGTCRQTDIQKHFLKNVSDVFFYKCLVGRLLCRTFVRRTFVLVGRLSVGRLSIGRLSVYRIIQLDPSGATAHYLQSVCPSY